MGRDGGKQLKGFRSGGSGKMFSLLGKGGRAEEMDTDCIRHGGIERVINRFVEQMTAAEGSLGQWLDEHYMAGLGCVIFR